MALMVVDDGLVGWLVGLRTYRTRLLRHAHTLDQLRRILHLEIFEPNLDTDDLPTDLAVGWLGVGGEEWVCGFGFEAWVWGS